MNLHIVPVTEYMFLTSFKKETFSLKKKKDNWEPNDYILFVIGNQFAGLAQVVDDQEAIQFIHMIEEENRFGFVGDLREKIIALFGIDFEQTFKEQPIVTQEDAAFFLAFFETIPNDLHFYFTEIDYLYEIEKKKEIIRQKDAQEQLEKHEFLQSPAPKITGSLHTQSQFFLKEIGHIVGCETWIASNDQNRAHKGEKLGKRAMEDFPSLKIDDETAKRIALIDTIWFKGDYPVCAFETETTTSVYSGILRMGDLLSVMPSVDMKLYIVAPLERKEKVLKEMNRPLFKQSGVTDYCRYIPLEHLEVLLQKIKGLDGFVSPHVLEAIAISPKKMLSF